jgi:hypothetical protein
MIDLNAYEDSLAEKFAREYTDNPDWKDVAERADAESIGEVLSLLTAGQQFQAKQKLGHILVAVARDHGELQAARIVNQIASAIVAFGAAQIVCGNRRGVEDRKSERRE